MTSLDGVLVDDEPAVFGLHTSRDDLQIASKVTTTLLVSTVLLTQQGIYLRQYTRDCYLIYKSKEEFSSVTLS